MTPDNRTPRKRRRRRRRPQDGAPAGNGGAPNGNTASPGNEARARDDGGGLNRPRRRRSRNRKGGAPGSGRPMPGDNGGTQSPVDIPPGEQVTVSGVLFLKNNGSGLLVQPGNNYVPQATDALVPRSMIERLHLQP